MKGRWEFTIPLLYLSLRVPCIAAGEKCITKELNAYLFDNYIPQLFPICSSGQSLTVQLNIALRQIISLNEKDQILSTNVWIRMGWYDCRLSWAGHPNFSHIDRLVVPYDYIWTPDLALYDSCAEEAMMPGKDEYRAQINSSGYIHYNFPTVLSSVCRVRVTYFPFDTQICVLPFGSWSHSVADLDMDIGDSVGDLDVYIENSEWMINELPAKRCETVYASGNYSDARYKLVLRRRPVFYLVTMLFPCILTCAVATIGFLLPTESGEKISLEVTVLLSLAVFLLVISDLLPPSSESFPIIGSYFAGSMALVSLSLVMAVFVLHLHYKGEAGSRVPDWARRIFIRKQFGKRRKWDVDSKSRKNNSVEGTFTSFQNNIFTTNASQRETESLSDGSSETNLESSIQERDIWQNTASASLPNNPTLKQALESLTEHVQAIRGFSEERHTSAEINKEWKVLARILDRVFLVLYILISVTVSGVFTIQFLTQNNNMANVDVCEYDTS